MNDVNQTQDVKAVVKPLPKNVKIRKKFLSVTIRFNGHVFDEIRYNNIDHVKNDSKNLPNHYTLSEVVKAKLAMLQYVKDFLKDAGMDFDEFNGLAPTRLNNYIGYEFTTLWIWAEIMSFINDREAPEREWYKNYGPHLASVMRKYPKITGFLIVQADLHVPGNELLNVAKMEDADYDNDHTDEVIDNESANEFKNWIMMWCDYATAKDKMRVNNWFVTKKSHKQIFAEISKVAGNVQKFNCRLALFVERLFNQDGLDYFFEKTGFASKEDLFMAYFEKLTQFDAETKRSFIKKYLLGGK